MKKDLMTIKDIAGEEFTGFDTVNEIQYKDRNVSLNDLRRLATEWHKALDEIYLDDEATEKFFDKYGMDKKFSSCCAVIRKIFDLGMEKGGEMTYKTLEQQIQELWESRGMRAIEIRVESIGKNKFKWTITAEGVGKKK